MQSLIGKQLSVYDAAAVMNRGRDSVIRAIKHPDPRRRLKAWKLDTGCNRRGNETWRIAGEDLLDYMERNSNWK
jgi:hypothetical protein